MEKKTGKILVNEQDSRKGIVEGAGAVFEAVATTYGPKGRNVLLEKGFGRPLLTRDGVTVAKDVYFSDRLKNMGAQIVIEASETTNRIAGDGTSATSVLTYQLIKNGARAIETGMHPMTVKDSLTKDSHVLAEKLESMAVPVKEDQLESVATVSVGDPLIGQLIAEALIYVGKEGGIITEKAPIAEVEREYIDGYFLQSGFTALQGGKKEVENAWVIVSSKRITSINAVNQIITRTYGANNIRNDDDLQNYVQSRGKLPTFAFIGEFDEAAYIHIVNLINGGKIDAVIIKTPPQFGGQSKDLLEDIAAYAGCKPITDSTPMDTFDLPYIGTVDKLVTSKSETTLFGDNETETILGRIDMLNAQLADEDADFVIEKIKDRIAKLEGKVCIFRIGGSTETEREELEFRIEDAINSTRNAYNEGIVPGGGVSLLELSRQDISDITRSALKDTFKQLLLNAGLEAEVKLREALDAPYGKGFNLREGDRLVDVVKSGVIDPVTVLREVVKNSISAAGGALTVGAMLIFEDKE